ncbi:hypothetical protein G6F35_016695 [Rhizopus arrhizus]|nr:hypothetical protein G6F35_016695 [Rhizopus arrhizus]
MRGWAGARTTRSPAQIPAKQAAPKTQPDSAPAITPDSSVPTVHMNANAGRMMPGDAYVVNDPYHGGTHLPDVTVITPVFDHDGRQILFYVDGGRRRRAVHQLPVGEERRIPRTGRPRHPGLGPLAGAQSGSEHR